MITSTKFAAGQKVRFTRRCVLASNVPKNSQGYAHTALRLAEGDHYDGAGIIEPGTAAVVVDYTNHGTNTTSYPVVRVKGRLASTHPTNLELI
jgi:hypothetical protein